MTYPSGFDSDVTSLTYEYGDYSRLTAIKAVTASGTQTLRAYTYGSKGEIISIKDDRSALGGTGYTLKTYRYDKLDRPVSLTVTDSEKEGTAEQYTYECFILGKHTARNGVAGISPPRREFQKC